MQLIRFFLITLVLLGSSHSFAATQTDDRTVNWGVIPVGETTTMSFGRHDITKNFTDKYDFSLKSGSDATYDVAVTFKVCAKGCGNPSLAFGIYNTTGSLISDSGEAVLKSGNYVFQVKGTGVGSRNSVGYSGGMTFVVSGVPEPADYLLMLAGLSFLGWTIKRRERAELRAAGEMSRPGQIWDRAVCAC